MSKIMLISLEIALLFTLSSTEMPFGVGEVPEILPTLTKNASKRE